MDEILVVAICLFLNALFAAYEMAFVSVQRSELRKAAKAGSKVAQTLLSLRDNPERPLSTIQIGITLVSAIAAAVGGAGAAETLEPYFMQTYGVKEGTAEILSVGLAVAPITYLSVVIGELVPKSLALRSPLKIVLAGARPLFIADRILSPMVTVLEWSTKKILVAFFKKAKAPIPPTQSQVEIDSLSPAHQRFVLNMAEIEKRKIKDILVPWDQVVSVEQTLPMEEILQVIISSGHTRIPVSDNGHVVGILHTKEFITLKESGGTHWQAIIRPAIYANPTDSALGVMRQLQEKRSHLAIVATTTGERLGIVTMEDILEEVVGDIFDEDDDGYMRKVYAARTRSRLVSPKA